MKTVIIGEKLNSSNRKIRDIFESRDEDSLLLSAGGQLGGGADYIDINSSMLMEGEKEALFWAGDAILERYDTKLSIDSPNLALLTEAAERYGERSIINSLTCDDDILAQALPVLRASGSSFILLMKNRKGIPSDAEGRISLARMALKMIEKMDIPDNRVMLDPVFTPVATGLAGSSVTLATLEKLSIELPSFGRVGGLSNISYGLPMRRLLNRTFLAMAVAKGITALICDPTDKKLMGILKSAEAIAGSDKGCREYLRYYRASKE
ncbi:MAG: dihydropteroate synthase [Candidatus Krumholzibacteriota bacterium]|nr:dihydropteroate synthase [Candidatus Krumholzibacteriota bacterium]